MQYILPMFALVLGMMYEDRRRNEHIVEKAALVIIGVLVPFQLLATWMQGQVLLSPYLYLFSIYQHLEYVPVIAAGGYLVELFSLWHVRPWRALIVVAAAPFGIYIAASGSILAAGLAFAGGMTFIFHRMSNDKAGRRRVAEWAALWLMSGAGTAYHLWAGQWTGSMDGGQGAQQIVGYEMQNVQIRLDSWLYYFRGIIGDPSTFLLGHSTPPDREMWASAHNYYLDFIYNFGVIPTLALLALIGFTVIQIYQNRRIVMKSAHMAGLAIVVLFLVIPDNLLKVGMRQPYPGIITFFLWGLLLARLESLRMAGKSHLQQRRAGT
jgi:O-antigen ligase